MIERIYHLTMTATAIAAMCVMAVVGYRTGEFVKQASTGVERVVSSVERITGKFSSVVDRFEKRKLFSPEIEEEP